MKYSYTINHFKNSDIYQKADDVTRNAFDKYFYIFTDLLDDGNGISAIRDHQHVATEIFDYISDNINVFSHISEGTIKLVTEIAFLNEEVMQFVISAIKLKATLIVKANSTK